MESNNLKRVPQEILGEIVYSMDLRSLINFLQSRKEYRHLFGNRLFWYRYFTRQRLSTERIYDTMSFLFGRSYFRLLDIYLQTLSDRGGTNGGASLPKEWVAVVLTRPPSADFYPIMLKHRELFGLSL